jgi:potassium voltage-gated channel Eag-related subfamily H protein 8
MIGALINDIWETGNLTSIWKLADVILIPKPSKDHSEPSNYRPIALTSCVCKTMERMINARLIWFLESNGLLSNIQCGFRQGRSTLDHLDGRLYSSKFFDLKFNLVFSFCF